MAVKKPELSHTGASHAPGEHKSEGVGTRPAEFTRTPAAPSLAPRPPDNLKLSPEHAAVIRQYEEEIAATKKAIEHLEGVLKQHSRTNRVIGNLFGVGKASEDMSHHSELVAHSHLLQMRLSFAKGEKLNVPEAVAQSLADDFNKRLALAAENKDR